MCRLNAALRTLVSDVCLNRDAQQATRQGALPIGLIRVWPVSVPAVLTLKIDRLQSGVSMLHSGVSWKHVTDLAGREALLELVEHQVLDHRRAGNLSQEILRARHLARRSCVDSCHRLSSGTGSFASSKK